MHPIPSLLGFIKIRLHFILLVAIALGLANVHFLGGWRVPKPLLVGLVTFGVIYPVMVSMRFEDVFEHFRSPRPLFCSLTLNFLLSPGIAALIAWATLRGQPEMHAALMLLALVPTSAMSAAWTAFSGARLGTALYLIPANLLFAAFVALPLMLPWLLGGRVAVSSWGIARNVLLVFVTPLVLGDLTRRLLIRWRGLRAYQQEIMPHLGGLSALGVTVLIFVVMGQRRNAVLLQDSQLLWQAALSAALYYLTLYSIALGWAWLLARGTLPRDKALVLVYTSVTRHVNISLALVLSVFPPPAVPKMMLLLVVAFVIQVPTMAFFAQHFGKRFLHGSASKEPGDGDPPSSP